MKNLREDNVLPTQWRFLHATWSDVIIRAQSKSPPQKNTKFLSQMTKIKWNYPVDLDWRENWTLHHQWVRASSPPVLSINCIPVWNLEQNCSSGRALHCRQIQLWYRLVMICVTEEDKSTVTGKAGCVLLLAENQFEQNDLPFSILSTLQLPAKALDPNIAESFPLFLTK